MSAFISRRRLSSAFVVGRHLPIYVGFAVLKYVLPVRVLARLAWRAPAEARDPQSEAQLIARLLRTANIAGARDRDCLQRSLLIYHALSKAGADPVLVVGLSRSGGRLRGHAWVIADGRVIAEPSDHVAQFEAVLHFGQGGRLLHPSLA